MMVHATSLWPSAARAESPPSVAQARTLFNEALKDEEAGRFADAATKLARVQSFRDTSPVRYQIAKCTEGLGKFAKARELYLRSVDGTQIPSAEDPSVSTASREQAMRLSSHIGYVRIDGPAMQENEHLVGVDDEDWAGAGLREVDPGTHELRIQTDDGKSRTVGFTATAMNTTSVKLFPVKEPVVAAAPVVAPVAPAAETDRGRPSPLAWVGLGVGGAFLAGGIVSLVVRENEIASITARCPGDRCPSSAHDDVEGERSRAHVLLPVGVGAVALGGLGLGAGAGLLLFGPRQHRRDGVAWQLSPTVGGARIGGTF